MMQQCDNNMIKPSIDFLNVERKFLAFVGINENKVGNTSIGLSLEKDRYMMA